MVAVGHPVPKGARFEAAAERFARMVAERDIGVEPIVADATNPDALSAVLARLGRRRVVVLPLLMNAGATHDMVRGAARGRNVRLCRPLGAAPAVAAIARELALAACARPATATLILVAHGDERDPRAQATARRHARYIATTRTFRRVVPAYLEAEPGLGDAVARVDGPVVVVALFLGRGRHVVEDVGAALARRGPAVAYAGSVGDTEAMMELGLRRLRRAIRDARHGQPAPR